MNAPTSLASKMAKALLVGVIFLFLVIYVFDLPHRLWHHFDSEHHAARVALFKPSSLITTKILRCIETNQGSRLENFGDFYRLGVLSSGDLDFLAIHAAIYYPVQLDSPTNTVVFELPQAKIVSLKNGFVTWKKP